MNFDHAFTDMTLKSQTGSSTSGDPTFGTASTIRGAVLTVNRRVATAQGVAVVPVSVLITADTITMGDLLWLPGANTSSQAAARRLGTVRTRTQLDGSYTLFEVDL